MKISVTLAADDQIAWFDCSCEIRFADTPASVRPPDGTNPYCEERDGFIHQMIQHDNRHAIGFRTLEIEPDGMREEVAGHSFSSRWCDLDYWIQTDNHIFIVHPTLNAHVIPKRCISDPAECLKFTQMLSEKLKERTLTHR